jgi:hypothetical protein
MPGVRLGLSGPAVIETARGRNELDAGDAATVARVFGAEARAAAGHVELLADSADDVRRWIARGLADPTPLAAWVQAMQVRLATRLADAFRAGAPASLSDPTGVGALSLPPLPQNLAGLYAHAMPVDPAGWLARLPDGGTWLCRPVGAGTFGPREANGLDSTLLADVAPARPDVASTLILIGDSQGHEVSRLAESLCVSQYLAQHAAVLALLRAQGVVLRGLLSGVGHSAEFFRTCCRRRRSTRWRTLAWWRWS